MKVYVYAENRDTAIKLAEDLIARDPSEFASIKL